ncbi:MAG TPA: L-tyrosine/L-tryptophan isonitrile synthase family protein [Gemmataceae bacterium]|nr:L-tyrosine/L-tryptophan isonitrile synthase family protein [Gemmataceae bacterium]
MMNTLVLPDLPDEVLRSRVHEVVRRHWVQPHAAEPLDPPDPDCVEQFARTALDTMLTRQFRVGPLPSAQMYEQFLNPIRRFVRKGKPIRVTVGYGPLKNPNAVAYSRVDWAEFFALGHLVAWHNKVQKVYPPGLQFQIYFDDETLLLANFADKGLMLSYMSSIAALIRVLEYQTVFLPPTCITNFAWFLRFGPYQLFRFTLMQIAERRVRLWERDPANREQVERMKEFARRNVVVPAELGDEERERFLEHASHRFRVCWDALRMGAQIFPDRGRLLALYLDGSQHHRQQTALHLTSVDKGQVTQPWQGEGVLLDNGREKLEPFVLTSGRRSRYHVRVIDGLDIVSAAGFERLAVVWPQTSTSLA